MIATTPQRYSVELAVWLATVVVVVLVCLSAPGCAVMQPGKETAAAYTQSSEIRYADNDFGHITKGPQEAKITAIGANGDLKINDDGTINFAESHLTGYRYIQSDPSGAEVTKGMDQITTMGIALSQMTTDFIGALIPLIGRAAPVPIPPADTADLQAILERLDRIDQGGVTPPIQP